MPRAGTWLNQLPPPAPPSSNPIGAYAGTASNAPLPPIPSGRVSNNLAVSPTLLGQHHQNPPVARTDSAAGAPSPSPAPVSARIASSASLNGARGSAPSMSASSSVVLPKVCPRCAMRYPPEFNVCPKDAAELVDAEDSDDELVGTVLAETYAIIRSIGEGGMGRVYEARHTRIGGKRFAVKLLHPEYARTPEVLSRFQREAEAAATIESPNVGDVYDIGRTEDGRPFIVAEFLEGRELADFLREKGRLDVPTSVRIVRQICKALGAAHERGIVHRDMKPENVFLVGNLANPTVKVIDFGISKVKEAGGQSLTKTGMIMGTPSYMAPEQAKGEQVDHRVDIYAAGAILYELCTGKRPFDKVDPTATIMAVLLEEPERPCTLNPQLPEALEMVIQRAMAKSADTRYQSMSALENELAAFAERTPPGASVMPPPNVAPHLRQSSNATRTLDARERDVVLSRPTIALLGTLGTFGALGVLMSISSAIIRLTRGGTAGTNVTGSEALLLGSLLTATLATPIGFAVYWVRKNVWSNSAKTIALASSMKNGIVSAFVAYGVVSLAIRLTEALLMRQAAGVAWPVWDILSAVVGVVAGITSFGLLRDKR